MKKISILIILFFLLSISTNVIKASPSNNPIFTTIETVEQMISDALDPLQDLINNLISGLGDAESDIADLQNRVTQLENIVYASPTPTPIPTSTPAPVPTILFSDNLDSGNTNKWEILGGTWQVINGQLVGSGEAIPLPMALVKDLVLSDYIIELDMTSITRVDKIVFVRFQDINNFIDLNFRAARPLTQTDVVIQETVNGIMTRFTPEFSVPIPTHQLGEQIHIRIEGKGDSMKILVNNIQVLDRSFPYVATQGKFGLGVFNGNSNSYDNVVISSNP